MGRKPKSGRRAGLVVAERDSNHGWRLSCAIYRAICLQMKDGPLERFSADPTRWGFTCRGGRYYLAGNKNDDDPDICFWVWDNLIRWRPLGTYRPDLARIAGHPNAF